jgi:Transcriptional regulator PadR-like family
MLIFHMSGWHIHVAFPREPDRPVRSKLDILQGTLDVMVLRTLFTLGPLHGYGIARRIEQVSGDRVILNQGTIYTSLVRLQQRGWIRSKWASPRTTGGRSSTPSRKWGRSSWSSRPSTESGWPR